MEIKNVTKCVLQDADGKIETQQMWLIESVYTDGRLFQFQYDKSVDVKPSLRGILCTIGVNNKKPTPRAWSEESKISWESPIPLKPHYARKRNFHKNPRKCALVKFEFNPRIDWQKYHYLVGAKWELYIQLQHPKLWNHPDIRWGFGLQDQQGNIEHKYTFPKLGLSPPPTETLH